MRLLRVIFASGLVLFSGCVIPNPVKKEVEREVICGVRQETGEEVIVRKMFRPYLYSMTPIGELDGSRWTEYSLRRGPSETRLPFLDQESRRSDRPENPDLNNEILPIRGTKLWAAFACKRVLSRSTADLKMIIFDLTGIRSTHAINGAIRQIVRSDGLAQYSVGLDPATGRVTIQTETGELYYDPAKDRVVLFEHINK